MKVFNFRKEVVERSKKLPVVVSFWAPWCAPYKHMGPIIEEMQQQCGDKWRLVKINIDEYRHVVVEHNIHSLPTLKMFYWGNIVAELRGNVPKHALIRWFEDKLPDERKIILDDIMINLEGKDRIEALIELEIFAEENSDLKEARLMLAKEKVWHNPVYACQIIKDIKNGDKYYDVARDIRTFAEMMQCRGNLPQRVTLKIKAAQIAVENEDKEAAINYLLDAALADKNFSNQLPHRACVAFFNLLGEQHPLTQKYLQMIQL